MAHNSNGSLLTLCLPRALLAMVGLVETAGARIPHHAVVTLQPASLGTCPQGKQNGHANETPEPDTCRNISVSLLPELLGDSHSTDMERQGGATRTLQRLDTEE